MSYDNRNEKYLPVLSYWVQEAIPNVYDDSLSLYELINKVVMYLNKVVESQNGLLDEMVEFKEWAKENIQEMTTQIINGWLEDGTLAKLINDDLMKSKIDKADNPLFNKERSWVFIGDSISRGEGSSFGGLPYLLNKKYDVPVSSFGRNGTTLATISGSESIINQLSNIKPQDTDVVLLGGVNDIWLSNKDNKWHVGHPEDMFFKEDYSKPTDTSKSVNALEYIILTIKEKNPKINIYFIQSPTNGDNIDFSYNYAYDVFKYICWKHGVQFIETQSDFVKWNDNYRSQYVIDSVHPNDLGYMRLFKIVESALISGVSSSKPYKPSIIIIDDRYDTNPNIFNQYLVHQIIATRVGLMRHWSEYGSVLVMNWNEGLTEPYQVDYSSTQNFVKVNIKTIKKLEMESIETSWTITFKNPKGNEIDGKHGSIIKKHYPTELTLGWYFTSVKQLNVGGSSYVLNEQPHKVNIDDLPPEIKATEYVGNMIVEVLESKTNILIQRWTFALVSDVYVMVWDGSNTLWRKM